MQVFRCNCQTIQFQNTKISVYVDVYSPEATHFVANTLCMCFQVAVLPLSVTFYSSFSLNCQKIDGFRDTAFIEVFSKQASMYEKMT